MDNLLKEIKRTREWFDVSGLSEKGSKEAQFKKFCEEHEEFVIAVECGNHENEIGEAGDVLFSFIGLVDRLGVSLEELLHFTNNKNYDRLKEGRIVGQTFVKKEDLV